jgi:hypothetical protein
MQTVKEYIDAVAPDKQDVIKKINEVILKNLPKGFEAGIGYNMLAYFVPHSIYPDGYHCNPKLPLPFISLAAQKNTISLHHLGIYSMPELAEWFADEYPKHATGKLDMGKGCIKFKKMDDIPYDLIGKLVKKVSLKNWIECYETNVKKSKK